MQPQHQPQPRANAEVASSKLRVSEGREPPYHEPTHHEPEPELEPEPETNGDADSSFGDISLGVDDDELELTMRQYD